MREAAGQLTLELPVSASFAADDFLAGACNAAARLMVERWPDWPDPLLHLSGPAGSGKSHLAAIWAGLADAAVVDAAAVSGERVPALARLGALVVEDLDRGPRDDGALFHLLNLARERGLFLLVTSAAPPEGCGLSTPDLVSRLRLAPSVTLGPPDDALLRAVLVKLLVDRQLVVETSVVEYVATRIERSFASAALVVRELDRESLSRGRRITRPIAAAVLSRCGLANA